MTTNGLHTSYHERTWIETYYEIGYKAYESEFGHLEGDTIIDKNHKSGIITFAERVFKLIIALETPGHKAEIIEWSLNNWFKQLPKNLFKTITFDCGKEFSS